MAPRKSTKKPSAPKRGREPPDEEKYSSRLERAETARSRKAAMLQLRMGRTAHVLGIVSGLALAVTAVLAYLLENWSYLIDAPEYVAVLKWILPLAAGVLVAAAALVMKWEPYFGDRTDLHFLLSISALAVPVMFVILIALDEAGKVALGRPDWLYPISLLGISLTLASLAMTWEGRGRRKCISVASAAFPPILLTFPMIFHFDPIDLASILPMAYLGSAVAIQLSGSMLHIIASATSVLEREVLKASDGKLREQINSLERRRVALDYREEAFWTKESDLEAYEKRLAEEIEAIDERKKQVSLSEVNLEQRAQEARAARQELVKKEAEIESKLDTLRLKQRDIDSQTKEIGKRTKSLESRQVKLLAKETELDKRSIDMQTKEREVRDGIADIAEERSTLEFQRKELDSLQDTLAEKEKQVAMRETTADLRTLETVAVKEEIGRFAEEKGATERLQEQLLERQKAIAEREVALRSQEEIVRKKTQKAERIIARADKQMNELVEKESEILERKKELAQAEADHRSAIYSIEAQQEEIRLSKEESAATEKQYVDMSLSLRKRLDEANSLKEDFAKKLTSLERREQLVKEIETRLKTEHERSNAKVRELIAKDKSLRAKETELGLRLAELKSRERQLLRSVDDFEDARTELPGDSEGAKTIEVRERQLAEKEREMKSRLYQREKELEKREQALQSHLRKDIEEMEVAVETEYAEKKVKTGIERLDDLLLGGMPFASNVLYIGPPFIGKETAMLLFIAEGLKKGVPAVVITTSQPPTEIAKLMAPIMPTFKEFDQLGLVRWIDASGGDAQFKEGNGGGNEIRVAGPDDYDGILDALNATVESLRSDGNPYMRIAYMSLSMSIPEAEDKRAYKFVRTFAGKVRQESIIGVYALERGMHTDQQLESLQHQMTGALQFKSEKQKTLLSVQGICDAQTRDWIQYKHSNKAIMIGAFSLERIR